MNITTMDIIWTVNLLAGALYFFPHRKRFWKWFGLIGILGGIIHFLIN